MISSPLINFFVFFVITGFVASELRFVFEHFRHGARSPITDLDVNNFDPLFKQQWNGAGELTKVGMRQHYLLGHRNQVRYGNFLSSVFDPNDIMIISTDYNRTIMSAYSQLFGMYPLFTGPVLLPSQIPISVPPNNRTFFEEEITKLQDMSLPFRMQLFPIHIFDPFQNFHSGKGCPTVNKMTKENRKQSKIIDFVKDFNKTFGNQLKDVFGTNNTDFIFDLNILYNFCDSFICSYTDDRNMSELEAKGINLREMNKSASEFIHLSIFDVSYGDIEKKAASVVISPTMLNLVAWMDKQISLDVRGEICRDYSCPKFIMYSGHDITVGAMESFMEGAFGIPTFPVPFASNSFFELYRRDNVNSEDLTYDDYYVVYIYNDVILLNMTYIEFKKAISSFAMSTEAISEFCSPYSINYFLIATIVLGNIVIILVTWLIVAIYTKKQIEKMKYIQFNSNQTRF